MATTTTNFGWDIPQSTDLVKDGATAIAALGQDIDTALVDLKGGTTGQVLAKATNTDLDFSWVAQDDSNAIQNAIVDAKGDIIAATANDTPARLAVGTNGQVLTADSTAATGLKWASVASGFTFIKSQTIGSGVTSVTVTDAFSSTYDNYLISYNLDTVAATANISLQLGSNTSYRGNIVFMADTSGTINGANYNTSTSMFLGYAATDGGNGQLFVSNPNKTKKTSVLGSTSSFVTTQSNNVLALTYYDTATTAHTAFTLISTQNMTGGAIRVYGYQNS